VRTTWVTRLWGERPRWFYRAWNHGLALVSAPRTAIFINVQPVVGVAHGVLLLGKTATMATLAGAVLVIAGLVVTGVRL